MPYIAINGQFAVTSYRLLQVEKWNRSKSIIKLFRFGIFHFGRSASIKYQISVQNHQAFSRDLHQTEIHIFWKGQMDKSTVFVFCVPKRQKSVSIFIHHRINSSEHNLVSVHIHRASRCIKIFFVTTKFKNKIMRDQKCFFTCVKHIQFEYTQHKCI